VVETYIEPFQLFSKFLIKDNQIRNKTLDASSYADYMEESVLIKYLILGTGAALY